jgi:hypothetical protein
VQGHATHLCCTHAPSSWSCFLFLFAVCALHLLSCLLLPISLLPIQNLNHQSKNFTRSNAVPLLLTAGLSGIYIQRGCSIGYNEFFAIFPNRLGWISVTFILPEQHHRQSWRRYRLSVYCARAYGGTVELPRTMRSKGCLSSRPFYVFQRLV